MENATETPNPAKSDKMRAFSLEGLYLRLFKYTVVGLMTLALLGIAILLPIAAYKFFQSPVAPPPVQPAPDKSINMDDLKRFLIEQEKQRIEQEKRKASGQGAISGIPASQAIVTPTFEGYVIPMYVCMLEYARSTDETVQALNETEVVQQREDIRARIEKFSNGNFKGEPWVKAVTTFMCSVMKDPGVIALKKERKIGPIFLPTVNFHEKAWVTIQREKFEFEQAEIRRVDNANAAERARIALAKAEGGLYLGIAGAAFLLFLALALYLIFAKIEGNLALIHQSIATFRQPL